MKTHTVRTRAASDTERSFWLLVNGERRNVVVELDMISSWDTQVDDIVDEHRAKAQLDDLTFIIHADTQYNAFMKVQDRVLRYVSALPRQRLNGEIK